MASGGEPIQAAGGEEANGGTERDVLVDVGFYERDA
jgi:hypothetical protein